MNNRISVVTIDKPEFVNLQPLDVNPLMSKCEIKVLYVGQNRNGSAITKQVASEMSKTLRGCPIVGYYVESKQDFGDHGDQMIIDGEGVKFNKLTKPYGFVAPDAKVWFQFFEDTDEFGNSCVREYLMTEGYLWTGQFEEVSRVLDNNNPQSMELDGSTIKGHWATDNNSGLEFFIIDDAIFSSLCILGEDVEPCFEGASVNSPIISSQFSMQDFVKELHTMMRELKYALNNNEGGIPMEKEPITQFEDGGDGASTTTDAAETTTESTESTETPASDNGGEETTPEVENSEEIPGVELNETDQAIIESLNESYVPEGSSETVAEAVVKDGATNVPTQILQNSKSEDDEDKDEDKTDKSDNDNSDKDNDKENSEDEDKDEDDKKKFSLEDYEKLQSDYASLLEERNALFAFKQEVENKQKDELINSFYMLSDEDKAEVVKNKTNYSLDEIESKLSVICVRKKVSFDLNDDSEKVAPTVFNLNSLSGGLENDEIPTWLRTVEEARKNNRY